MKNGLMFSWARFLFALARSTTARLAGRLALAATQVGLPWRRNTAHRARATTTTGIAARRLQLALFGRGVGHQMLAAIALCVATGILIKSGRLKYAWVTGAPLLWLAIITTTAVYQKITSDDPRIGFFAAANDLSSKLAAGVLPPEKAAVAPQLIFNQQLDAWLALLFASLLWIIIFDMLRMASRHLRGMPVPASAEAPHVTTRLEAQWVRD